MIRDRYWMGIGLISFIAVLMDYFVIGFVGLGVSIALMPLAQWYQWQTVEKVIMFPIIWIACASIILFALGAI